MAAMRPSFDRHAAGARGRAETVDDEGVVDHEIVHGRQYTPARRSNVWLTATTAFIGSDSAELRPLSWPHAVSGPRRGHDGARVGGGRECRCSRSRAEPGSSPDACSTACAARARLVATDLNEAMLAHGRREIAPRSEFAVAPGGRDKLPFADGAFDAVVCQFGLMFFPDKAAGVREAFRVLRSGGQYLFNVWDAIEHNPITRITHKPWPSSFRPTRRSSTDALRACTAGADRRGWLAEAGFEADRVAPRRQDGLGPDGRRCGDRVDRWQSHRGGRSCAVGADAVAEIKQALAARIAARLGDRPCGPAARGRLHRASPVARARAAPSRADRAAVSHGAGPTIRASRGRRPR